MQDVKCRISVSFIFGLTTLVISALYNNAFWLDKNFKFIGKKSSWDRNWKREQNRVPLNFISSKHFKFLQWILSSILPFTLVFSSVRLSIRPSVHPSIRLSTIMCARQFLRNYLVDFNDTWYNPCMIGGVDARSLIFEIGPFSATRSRVKRSEIHFLLNISLKCQIGTYIVSQTYRKSLMAFHFTLWPLTALIAFHFTLWPLTLTQRSKFRNALFAQYLPKNAK